MELATPLETICRAIARGRELEAQVPAMAADEDENPEDADDPFAVLEDETNSVVEDEIRALLDELAEDQLAEMLALAWVGRGTYDAAEWADALEAAGDRDAEDPIDQLLDMPTLSANLEAGLTAFDLSCDAVGQLD